LFDAAAIWADDKQGTLLEGKKVAEQMPFVFVALLLVVVAVAIVFSASPYCLGGGCEAAVGLSRLVPS
jgi:hypothetical protein